MMNLQTLINKIKYMFDWRKAIKEFELNEPKDYRDFAKFIVNCWDNSCERATLHRNYLTLITGGWSDNEEVQILVDLNRKFGIVCWMKSERGGLTQYKLPKLK